MPFPVSSVLASGEPPPKLRPGQGKAVWALLAGGTHADAADAAGVTERTIRSWKREPGFVGALRWATADALEEAAAVAVAQAPAALRFLVAVVEDDDASTRDRMTAARALLDHAERLRAVTVTEDRLVALEIKIEEMTT